MHARVHTCAGVNSWQVIPGNPYAIKGRTVTSIVPCKHARLQGKLYIITEYASNGNLHDYIKRQKQKLPEELIWKLFMQVWGSVVTSAGFAG